MNGYRIAALRPALALDSRGNPTVSCEVHLDGGAKGCAVVPSGASTGSHEAHERRDGGAAFAGRGVDSALALIASEVEPALRGHDARDQEGVDAALAGLEPDGGPERTTRFAHLGANTALAVSMATALAAAAAGGQQPYRYLADGDAPLLPLPMVNIFSGGAHASAALDVQDLLVVPVGAPTFEVALRWTWEVRHAVASTLSERGLNAHLVADEGGFGVALRDTREGLETICAGIERAGLAPGADVAIAMDVAATELLGPHGYLLAAEGRCLRTPELVAEVAGWCRDFPVVSVEDPLAEDDWDGFATASTALADQQLLGDDLFVTDPARLRRGVDAGIASAVLIKPNQCGTLSGAHDVVRLARAAGYATVLSARSGESEDSWLADLAVGWRTGQIKVGSLTRSERTAKWNRLLRIATELGGAAEYAGRSALVTGRDVAAHRQHTAGEHR